jgi:hypothetical protein
MEQVKAEPWKLKQVFPFVKIASDIRPVTKGGLFLRCPRKDFEGETTMAERPAAATTIDGREAQ